MVATNLQTGLDLRTGPYCCVNTNLRTGLDQAISGTWPYTGYNKQSTNESVWCPHTRLGDFENDTRG